MKKKFIKMFLIIILMILTILGIFIFTKNIVNAVESSTTRASINTGSLLSGEKDPSTYTYKTNFGTWIYEQYTHQGEENWYIPKKDGYQVYCIQPDEPIGHNWEIKYTDDAWGESQRNPQYIYCAEDVPTHAQYYKYQKQYVPKSFNQYHSSSDPLRNDHYYTGSTYYGGADGSSQYIRAPVKWEPKSTGNLTPAMSYIVSDEAIGQWTRDKQLAMWNLHGTGLDNGLISEDTKGKTSASSLDKEAQDYAQYDSEVRPNNGLQPEDLTSLDGVTTKVNQNTANYTVGPFKIKYTEGIYGNIAFSGISEMTIIGYNKNKVQIKDNIEIEKFILKDKDTGISSAKRPEYFEPSSNLKVDETKQVYPESDQEFQIVFSDPNAGLDVSNPNRIAYISIKVKFKYMLANGKFTYYDGTKKWLWYAHADTPIKENEHLICTLTEHTHTGVSGSCYSTVRTSLTCTDDDPEHVHVESCYGHTRALTCTKTVHTHTDACYKDCFDCKYNYKYTKTVNQQDIIAADAIRSIYEQELIVTPDGGIDITMDIAGMVWEDLRGGKETLPNGELDDGTKVEGITVVLWDEDKKQIDSTTTDSEGKYKFEKIDAMKKYYVEFQYNGQDYENTIYTDKLDGKHSTATESTSDRDAYNKKYEEVNGDEGYTKSDLDFTSNKHYKPGAFPKISAYTGKDGKDDLVKYPKEDNIVIAENDVTVAGVLYHATYKEDDSIKKIDFGIVRRIEFDMALKKDVYVATVKINGKTEVYGYDKRAIEDNCSEAEKEGTAQWTISVVGGYNRGLDDADWNFTGQNGNKDQLLEVYVTYKVAVRNQSMSMLGYVTKLYDYYDSTYEYQDKLSWQSGTNYKTTSNQLNQLQDMMEKGSTSSWGNTPKASDDKTGTLTVNVDKKQETGETQYLYLTFKIKNDGKGKVSLGNKENKVEIGAFKTYYKGGKTTLPHYNGTNSYKVSGDNMIAGRVDRDSIPSSMGKNGNPDSKEDDEDKAPGLDVKLTGDQRLVNGTVWEDQRTNDAGNSMIGDGILKGSETKIAGVTVELVEKTVWNSSNTTGEYVWQTATTGTDGKYSFKGYIPGDYVVRFKYGDTIQTVRTTANGGKNIVSYNGQDFRSTTYQTGVDQSGNTDLDNKYKGYQDVNNQNETGTYGYSIANKKEDVSDAKDIWSIRDAVNKYSTTNVTNGIAEILASPYQTPNYNGNNYSATEMDALLNELMKNTKMTSETGVIVVEVERNMQSNLEDGKPSYKIENINLGLVERAKAQLEIDKSITNIKVTLADSSILFDVNKAGDNVIWKDHTEYNLASKKKNNKYEEYYSDKKKNRYSYRTEVDKLVANADKGLVQLTMDEELMHGATIEITYQVKVTNAGEVDYEGQKFYYTGDSSGATVVTTKANQVVDYVANNLQFNSNDSQNSGWSVISADKLTNQNLVNNKLSEQLKKFNTIIQTSGLDTALRPGMSTTKTLVLQQLITPENTSDDLTYNNMVEIVKTSNTVGRRMAYSVVGNQDPTGSKATEVDASMSERVIILPPFGNTHIYYILGAVIAIILIGGITFIIRKVLKK